LSLAFFRLKQIPRDSFLSKRSQGEPIYGDDVIVSYKVVNRTLFSSASAVTVALIARPMTLVESATDDIWKFAESL
jgi:hypothetical protein